jgi:hypothetical protein
MQKLRFVAEMTFSFTVDLLQYDPGSGIGKVIFCGEYLMTGQLLKWFRHLPVFIKSLRAGYQSIIPWK